MRALARGFGAWADIFTSSSGPRGRETMRKKERGQSRRCAPSQKFRSTTRESVTYPLPGFPKSQCFYSLSCQSHPGALVRRRGQAPHLGAAAQGERAPRRCTMWQARPPEQRRGASTHRGAAVWRRRAPRATPRPRAALRGGRRPRPVVQGERAPRRRGVAARVGPSGRRGLERRWVRQGAPACASPTVQASSTSCFPLLSCPLSLANIPFLCAPACVVITSGPDLLPPRLDLSIPRLERPDPVPLRLDPSVPSLDLCVMGKLSLMDVFFPHIAVLFSHTYCF